MTNQRVALIIDGPNLQGMNQYLYAQHGKKINFKSFLKHIAHIIKGRTIITKRIYYDVHPNSDKGNSFVGYMQSMGFEAIGVPLKIYSPGPHNAKAVKSRTDNSIIDQVMDLLYKNEFDHLILISGDSDFQFLIERCKEMKKTVEIWAVYPMLAHEIKTTANDYFLFEAKNHSHLLSQAKGAKKKKRAYG